MFQVTTGGTPAMEISASWSVMIATAAFGFTIYQTIIKRDEKRDEVTRELVAMRQKVEVLWGLIFPASVAAALKGGILERHSPLMWTPKALLKMDHLTKEVKQWYDDTGHKFGDLQLLIQISSRFGSHIAQELLKDNEIKAYGFEAIALALVYLCRPDSELFTKYNTDEWQRKTGIPEG
jgi:hypothetical protein